MRERWVNMVVVGLTGGIGSGKSTVARAFLDRGAALVDADHIARGVVEPGSPVLEALVERFGPEILDAAGRLIRPALAERTFGDPEAVAALNAITHPAIGLELLTQTTQAAARGGVVVVDIPLLRPEHRALLQLEAVLVVDCPTEVAIARLVEHRQMQEADARARIASQVSREARLEGADHVVDNGGDLASLEAEVDRAWAFVQGLDVERAS